MIKNDKGCLPPCRLGRLKSVVSSSSMTWDEPPAANEIGAVVRVQFYAIS